MKVEIRFFANDEKNPCKDSEVARVYRDDFVSPWMVYGTDEVKQYLSAFSTGPGCRVNLHITFNWSNAKKCDYFVLTAKNIVSENNSVYDKNLEVTNKLPVHHITKFGEFTIRNTVFVNRIKSGGNRIWSMEFFEAFIAPAPLVDDMEREFSGFKVGNVLNYKTEDELPDWRLFYADIWLPKLNEDASTYLKN